MKSTEVGIYKCSTVIDIYHRREVRGSNPLFPIVYVLKKNEECKYELSDNVGSHCKIRTSRGPNGKLTQKVITVLAYFQ